MAPAIGRRFKEGGRVMVQKYIKGTEITCGVVEDGRGHPVRFAADRDCSANGGIF